VLLTTALIRYRECLLEFRLPKHCTTCAPRGEDVETFLVGDTARIVAFQLGRGPDHPQFRELALDSAFCLAKSPLVDVARRFADVALSARTVATVIGVCVQDCPVRTKGIGRRVLAMKPRRRARRIRSRA